MGNESQKEFWNGPAGDVWVEAQEIMDRMLAPLSEATLAAAMPKSGERIIDVGCGCGATSLALAESGATVWGLDISEVMLERARSRAEGNDNIVFSVKDAATADYDPEYVHRDIHRTNLSGSPFGINLTTDLISNDNYYVNYSFEVPNQLDGNHNPSNMHVLVYVYDVATLEIYQVIKVPIQ